MKTFIQTTTIPEFVIAANVLEKRFWDHWSEGPYRDFFYEWAAKGHYTIEPHPEDYRILLEDGKQILGYYWGDESALDKFAEYTEAKKVLPPQTYFVKQEAITCGDNEHPVFVQMQTLPIVSYSLASAPTTVITV